MAFPAPLAWIMNPPSPPASILNPLHLVSISIDASEASQLPRSIIQVCEPSSSRTRMSPGSFAATSTQPPVSGAVKVETNSDSPPKTLRLSDFSAPPSILASSAIPVEWAIMAPDSTLSCSPPLNLHLATPKLGACRTSMSMSQTISPPPARKPCPEALGAGTGPAG